MRTKALRRSMIEGPLLPNIILYTIPIILTSVLQLLFNAADLVVVGRYCGSISVGAVGATGSLTSMMVTLFMGFSTGAGVSVAHAIGGHQDETVRRTVHTAIPVALICGLALMVLGIFLSRPMLQLMDTPENVLPLSTVYMQIFFGGMVFNMLYNFCAAILRAAGDTKSPLIYLTLSGVLNVLLNLFFVTVLHMNVAGVALATTISQAVSAVLVTIALMRRTDACRLNLKKLRIYKPQLLKIIRIGLPAGLEGSLFGISNVMIQSSVNSFGEIFVAGNAAAANIEGFQYVSMTAFTQTALNFSGQNAGAHRYDRVRKTLFCCIACSCTVGLVMTGLIQLFGKTLLGIYITDSQEAIQYGIIRFGYISMTYFLCGIMDCCAGTMRGMGSSLMPMITSILGICGLRIVWINTIFAAHHTPQVLYISYPVSWLLTSCVYAVMLILLRRKRMRQDQALLQS